MSGDFACIVADPPWSFSDKLPGKGRGAVKHYNCMTQAQIMAYALPPIAPDAVLFLWRVASMPQEPLDVARAWGFRPHSELVWQKLTAPARPVQPCQLCGHTAHKHHFGMGRIVRGSHETCLIAVRGKPRILTRSIRSTFAAPVGRHSAKPEAFYDIVEDLCTGPRVELFARRNRAGWVCIGDEVGALDALDASDASDTNPVAKVG